MTTSTALGFANKTLDEFETYFENNFEYKIQPQIIIFISLGNPQIRARVIKEVSTDYKKAFQNLQKKVFKLIQKKHLNPQWMKMDIVTETKEIQFEELESKIANTRKNYFRYGIAFDRDFYLSFLEQEVNGNAMIRRVKKSPLALSETNINNYLKYNQNMHPPFIKNLYRGKSVYLFKTTAIFKERNSEEMFQLYNGKLTNGIRKINNIKTETESLIKKATYYLTDQVKSNGKFEYGYFSMFGKRIRTYNILRHSSSLYSMAEGYEIIKDDAIIKAVERGLDYLIEHAIVYKDGLDQATAFAVDVANENEIKLGSNATAILAMTKYMEVTNSKKYLEIAQALARGIIHMKLPDEGFIHVLSYPTFKVKDLHRIIYYEGEAIFSLLRLYAMDKNTYWLNEVKKTFNYFIDNDYWKHHDHWLSYAANEITDYLPEDKYFTFGLKNCNDRLNFIYHRETTYPTFLELTMAAYKMIDKIKKLNKEHLLKYIDQAFLVDTIDRRAEYQRVGFFYPELAMYKKNPNLILNGFFIRHHSFRVRIDDVEHYLSGYCQFLKYRVPEMDHYDLTLEEI